MNETPHENETDTRRRLLNRVGNKGSGERGRGNGDEIQAMVEAQGQKPIKVIKREREPSRSELTLLYELIQRNPERAKEFLRRLSANVRTNGAQDK